MVSYVRSFRPLTWGRDRTGYYQSGGWSALFQEQLRLGYLRAQLRQRTYVTEADLKRLLECAPPCLFRASYDIGMLLTDRGD